MRYDGTPNHPNMRRRRYGAWLQKAADHLRITGEMHTASSLMNILPDDRYSPPSANSAAQKMMKDNRFDSIEDYTTDLHGHRYKTRFFSYNYGENNEE